MSKILPPKAILVLGAVMPQRLRQLAELGGAEMTLAHPDDGFLKHVSEVEALATLGLTLSKSAISPTGGEVAFFKNSLDRESGFVPASALTPIWKNLEQISETKIASTSLQTFVDEAETPFNWLVIDRLDGLDLLQGAPDGLGLFDVVSMRSWSGEADAELNTTKQVTEFMTTQGFRLVVQASERHPSLETLLFAKDYGQIATDLQAYKDGQDSNVEKQRKLAVNNLNALEQRYADLFAKNKATEKLVADILTRLARAESALSADE
ncbi:MAG: hypothetical protein ACE37M_08240 [Henriciella sp.]